MPLILVVLSLNIKQDLEKQLSSLTVRTVVNLIGYCGHHGLHSQQTSHVLKFRNTSFRNTFLKNPNLDVDAITNYSHYPLFNSLNKILGKCKLTISFLHRIK